MKTTTVYPLHFSRPYYHAKHYIGSTSDLERRLEEHRTGKSNVNLLKIIHKAGITFELARTWEGDKTKERQLKRQGGASRLCPICKALKEKSND